jgi:hypothetical protein
MNQIKPSGHALMELPQLVDRRGAGEVRRWDAELLMLEQKQRIMQQSDYNLVTSPFK